MNKILTILLVCAASLTAQAQQWPKVSQEAKPGTRWWWLGSAVDKDNLQWTMQEYANHGIGAVEITPLYGVQGNQQNNIPYLSDQWMEMLREVQHNGQKMGIEVDMATGTGWPFGGPWVSLEESACRAIFIDKSFTGMSVEGLDLSVPEKDAKYSRLNRVMAYWQGKAFDVTQYVDSEGRLTWSPQAILQAEMKATKEKTFRKYLKMRLKDMETAKWRVIALHIRYGVMKVKRAAPGGEGLVIDHFDRQAVHNYLAHIEQAFERTKTPYPHTFFNDSYEVEAATWTPTLHPKIVSDYRETLGDLLLENFTQQWTAWAHSHGAITRNQAHGSPANLIDCYAAVDIPEIEGFGLSEFGIKGLRQDPGKTRKNDSDFSMLKYAPSAAHICGKPYTSSETFTWLTEHFRTSLSQLKPDIDLMFCAGVNHMFFHGTCYSPKDDPWPGWKFYASIDMSPTNSIWRDAPYFMQYVERCQSFLQMGQPDNDFLVYLPIRDMWQKQTDKLLMQFSIHQMGKLAPEFIQTILNIERAGFDCDYISDQYLMTTQWKNGKLQTAAGTRYRGLVIPECQMMPEALQQHIEALKAQGAHIIYGTRASDLAAAARPTQCHRLSLLHRQPLTQRRQRPAAAGCALQGRSMVQPPQRRHNTRHRHRRQHRHLPPQRRVHHPPDLQLTPASCLINVCCSIAAVITGAPRPGRDSPQRPLDPRLHRGGTPRGQNLPAREAANMGNPRRRQRPRHHGHRHLHHPPEALEERCQLCPWLADRPRRRAGVCPRLYQWPAHRLRLERAIRTRLRQDAQSRSQRDTHRGNQPARQPHRRPRQERSEVAQDGGDQCGGHQLPPHHLRPVDSRAQWPQLRSTPHSLLNNKLQ